MFPLGTVLVPGMVLPLHVFEPRYQELVRDCLAAPEPEFGVVLIERGSEVGGGDVRTDVGTVARILRADQLSGGRYALATAGVRRLRVTGWLDDEPYPRAEVEDWPDGDDDPAAAAAAREALAPGGEVLALLRRGAALLTELGEASVPVDVALADDPVLASYQAIAVAPLGVLDRQALLAAPTAGVRAARLAELLPGALELLEARLAGGGE
jgi:Lon protease-like protein